MKKGFTLLEMVVVIMVITALFLLTIPNIQNVIDVIQKKGCESQLKVIDTAIVEYMILNDEKPYDLNDLYEAGLISEQQMTCQNKTEIYIEDGQAYAQIQ